MDLIVLQNKARILREAADKIESGFFYWYGYEMCVIGNIAKVSMPHDLIRQGVQQIFALEGATGNSWTETIDSSGFCSNTGLSMNVAIAELQKIGFSSDEILRAEFGDIKNYQSYLKNLEECKPSSSEEPKSIVRRLRQWASEIDQLILQESAHKSPVTVAQPVR